MRTLKQILFTIVAIAGLSLAVSAQKGGGGNKPPKDPPPKIQPKPKDTPKDRPKKPGMSYFVIIANETEYAD